MIALTYLPGPLVSDREQGILRRLSTTPVPASWVLGAQLVVQAAMMLISALGAAVQAIQASMVQGFPSAAPLLVLAAYALVFGFVAKRFFRWE